MTLQKSNWRKFALLAGVVICLLTRTSSLMAEGDAPPAGDGVHPLDKPLAWARDGLKNIDENFKDYSCTLIKRERIKGKLSGHEFIFAKVRHEPFSVYMYFLKPSAKKGNECIYVEGQNDGKLWAIAGSGFKRRLGVVSLGVDSAPAMEGNRYPITWTGFRVLVERLIEMGEKDRQFGECEVKYLKNAKINGRVCTCIQVTHPKRRKQFAYHIARIFVDDQRQIPIRLEAYGWPREKGGKPVLVEEYTYVNVKLNNGYGNVDFDTRNEKYHFVTNKNNENLEE
jgi:hypothetical protein